MKRGIAELPLHEGHVPRWLVTRMKELAQLVVKLVVEEHGTEGLLERVADPLWFQALNNIIGMDWDSSGSTTVTTAILKDVLNKLNLEVYAAGGKGDASLRTPEELQLIASKIRLEGEYLTKVSALVAKVDSSALQAGYQLYHHVFLVDDEGRWAVVQQGMNTKARLARRYHWFSESLHSFVETPHHGVSGVAGYALNTVDSNLDDHRKLLVDLAKEDPSKLNNLIKQAWAAAQGITPLVYYEPYPLEKARTVFKKYAKLGNVTPNGKALIKAREMGVENYEELLCVKGVGPSTVRALALVAELVYETPPSWRDPVTHPVDPFKFAYAVGGKDGVPFPVDKKTYDELISILNELMRRVDSPWSIRHLSKLTKTWTPPPSEKVPT